MIKFTYTILYVKDVEKAISFYEKAFGFTRKFVTPLNEYGELLVGETTLSFATTTLANSNLKDGFLESSLQNNHLVSKSALQQTMSKQRPNRQLMQVQ